MRSRLRNLIGRAIGRGTESRAISYWGVPAYAGIVTASNSVVSPRAAEGLATVLACVSAISTAVASLPVVTYAQAPEGRLELPDHALARLIARGPNPRQSWPDFVEWLLASALLHGNALAEVVADDRGAIVELSPVPWSQVSVVLLPSGAVVYDVTDGTGGRKRRLLASDVIHLRDRSDDGVVGRSRLSRAAETVGNALAVQAFSGTLYRNGINPSGAFTVEGNLTSEQHAKLRAYLEQEHASNHNTGKPLILDRGAKWQQLSVSPEDAEVLDSRRFTTEELARLYQVPPPLVGIWQYSSFTNSETAGRWFAQFTLTPWVRKLECELSRVAGEGVEVMFDLSGFMRGDDAARWAAHKIAIETQVLTIEEVREIEGFDRTKPRSANDNLPALAGVGA